MGKFIFFPIKNNTSTKDETSSDYDLKQSIKQWIPFWKWRLNSSWWQHRWGWERCCTSATQLMGQGKWPQTFWNTRRSWMLPKNQLFPVCPRCDFFPQNPPTADPSFQLLSYQTASILWREDEALWSTFLPTCLQKILNLKLFTGHGRS